MSTKTTLFIPSALMTAATLLLSGCVVAPVGHPVYRTQPAVVYQQPPPVVIQQQQQQPMVVYQEPPPPQREVIGFAPAPGYFWISGIWLWEGNRHVWHPGRWEPQRNGQTYVPHQWTRAGNAWQLSGGHWRR